MTDFFSTSTACGACDKYQVVGNCNTDLVFVNTLRTQQLQGLQWLSVKLTNKEICFRFSLEKKWKENIKF